ncbi:MAG: LPS-assembly protein LptD [Bacteroidales bacterium]|nr:LPS-assembly protein LptD [Bacteroidales bacterium]
MISKIQIYAYRLLTTAKKQFTYLLVIFFFACIDVYAQDTLTQVIPVDTLNRAAINDSLLTVGDTLVADTALSEKKSSRRDVLEDEVKYSADDSFRIRLSEQKIYLYKKATVDYQNINLQSDYVEFDMDNSTVMAAGLKDTAELVQGKPVFKQDNETFESDTIMYNFQSHKGIIKYVVTQQGEGYLHSKQTKRLSDVEIHVKTGKYTTCDAKHPHFYIALTKAIAIPKDKIISGPAYLVLEDIPLPLALPFGFFPNTSTRASGLIIPKYGEEKTRGFYLKDGGWYFALNDYIDVSILGTVYSRGTWGANITTGYRKRYRFSGNFYAQYYRNTISDGNEEEQAGSRDYKIRWSHNQDPKANPTQSFSANVDFSTNSYEKNHTQNMNEYLTNTKTSSISYRKSWPGRPFNFAASMNHSQNSRTGNVDLKLPTMSFNVSRLYPFRAKRFSGSTMSSGPMKWLQNIQISYSAKLDNFISTTEDMLFTEHTLKHMKNGFYHTIPVSLTNIKLLKIINITPGLSYDGVLYTSRVNKYISEDSVHYFNMERSQLIIDTISGLSYAHALKPSLGISANPKVFARITSKKTDSYFAALRHVITPSASFGFVPDLSGIMGKGYYRTLVYPRTMTMPSQELEYSIFENGMYSTPVLPGKSGSLSLGLSNNIEMKVRPKNDTTGQDKKVSILDNLNFSASYNPFVDEFKWSTIGMSGSTKLFNNNMNITFGATFDPYALDADGKRINRSLFAETGKLLRTTRAYINTGFSLKSKAGGKGSTGRSMESMDDISTDKPAVESPLEESAGYYYGDYVDFNVPWSLRVDYSWSYSRPAKTANFTHTVRVSGDVSLTPKWKIGGNTGYDFVARKMSVTNLSIHRDLHCWEMRFTVVPFGNRKSYSFTINAKTSILRDLKYDKRKSWYDNF